ncbi:MAG TPA: hypothetical protein VFG87_11585 [Amycolatopsis sp.]|nr:hypothetical protein [Amycolatopsis sp.]
MAEIAHQHRLFVISVSSRPSFSTIVGTALAGLSRGERVLTGDHTAGPVPRWPAVCATLTERANAYLDEVLPRATVEFLSVPDIGGLAEPLRGRLGTNRPARPDDPDHPAGPRPWSSGVTVLFLVDATSAVSGGSVQSRLDATTAALYAVQGEFGIGLSPYSVLVFDEHDDDHVYSRILCNARQLPDDDYVLAADTIRAFTDLVQTRHANSRAVLPETEPPAALARAFTTFLTRQAGSAWGLHFFTGSIIAKLIQDTAAFARSQGNPVLRGPSEHSLAAGAMARWQLRQAPFLLVATSGMVDELRGTLANLRDTQARGFILFGETHPGTWQPFQGTVHDAEDARAVFSAFGLPCFHLTDPARLGQDLAAAFRAYHRRRGPVVLLASPSVLQYTGELHVPESTPVASRPLVTEDIVDAVARIVNAEPSSLTWQCGSLSEAERALVHRMAREAGIALVDSLARPGTVAKYHDGELVEEYLGTLSLYGYSPPVWNFLHPGGQLAPYDRAALFFLKSRITDLATPFPEKALYDKIRVVQVTDTPEHIAPFTDIPVIEPLESFLHRLSWRLAPEDWIVSYRRDRLARARENAPGDPMAEIPSVPMTHEYFFSRLNDVLEHLITKHGYRYTGFYDVGRGGISAVRNLARTDPGFSGWYGRAIMGDAASAIPALALSDSANILAFIGDGAARLVPSFLPSLAQQIRHEGARVEGNVSIFYLLNGGFSIIRSYRELQHAATADAQMSLLTPVEPEWQQTWDTVSVTHERLTFLDPEHLAKRLLAPATVNLFSTYLAHDNEGDNIMPLSRKNWRMR